MKKTKKILKYAAYTSGACAGLVCLVLAVYYFFMFKNPDPLSSFVPQGGQLFVSVCDPGDAADALQAYLTDSMENELLSKSRLHSADRLRFILGDEVAYFTMSGSWGVAAKISFPAKLALIFPGIITGCETEERLLRGNSVTVLNFNNTELYLNTRWNICTLTPSREIAEKSAELLNRRPVAAPLALDKKFREITSAPAGSSAVYFSCDSLLENTPLGSVLKDLSACGGVFSISSKKITSALRLKGLSGDPADSLRLPEYGRAFIAASFPCDINTIWLDFCRRVQQKEIQYSSFVATLTSEVLDPVISSMKPAVFLYGFKSGKKGLGPSGVLCFETARDIPEENLVRLFHQFIQKAQALNQERVRRAKVQSVVYALRATEYNGTPVHYIKITPLAVPNFIPGFCKLGNRILAATDQRELKHVLAHLGKAAEPVPEGYYIRITDPGMQGIFTFIARSLNDPSRKRRMGEASFARAIDRVNRAEKWSRGIGSVSVRGKKAHPEFRTLEIEIKPVSQTGKPANNTSQIH